MGRKKVLKVSKTAMILCPSCGKKSRSQVREGIYFFECKRCKSKITTPPARCCIICAYSDKQCPATIQRRAKAEGLRVKGMEITPIQIHS